jgi:hypothetical protein
VETSFSLLPAAALILQGFAQSLEYGADVGQATAAVYDHGQIVRMGQTSIGVDDNRRESESSQHFGGPSRAFGYHTLASELLDALLQRLPEYPLLVFNDKY